MSDKFHDIIPNNRRSIRNIPIPTKEEKAALDAEAIKEDKETAGDNIQKPTKTIHHGDMVQMDGIKTVKRARRKTASVGVHIEIHDEPEREVQVNVKPKNASSDLVPKYTIEPAFMDKVMFERSDFVEKDEYLTKSSTISNSDYVTDDSEDVEEDSDSEQSFNTWRKRHKKGYVFWLICVGAFAAIFITISSFFVSAHVQITPKKYDVTLDSTKLYIADISYKTTEANAETSLQVASKGTIKVDRKASGTVVLYNAYTSTDQKLVANTRLETSEGKIFRLDNPATIPGQKTVSGKKVPGSVEVQVTADKTGDDYNVGFKDFKFSAYKGTEKYDKVYGRSKTSIGNGYTGNVPNISQKDIASSTTLLKSALVQKIEETLIKNAEEYSGYVYIPGSYIITYNPVTQKVSGDGNQVTITGIAKATAVLFDRKTLSKQILKEENILHEATTTVSKIAYTGDVTKIKVAFPKDTISSDLTNGKSAYFTVTGTSTIYSAIDENILSQAISHLTKTQAIPVVKELVDSEKIKISIWPWWISTLPTKTSIKVDIL